MSRSVVIFLQNFSVPHTETEHIGFSTSTIYYHSDKSFEVGLIDLAESGVTGTVQFHDDYTPGVMQRASLENGNVYLGQHLTDLPCAGSLSSMEISG